MNAMRSSTAEAISSTQHLLSQSTKHLPPAGPPLILLAILPTNNMVATYTRRLGLATVGATILSWSHNELTKKRKLGHLPLPSQSHSHLSPHNLPPILPESLDLHSPPTTSSTLGTFHFPSLSSFNPASIFNSTNPNTPQVQTSPKPSFSSALAAWRERSYQNKMAKLQIRRTAAVSKLLRIQEQKRHQKLPSPPPPPGSSPLGYALVTGASRGIGRALAVELARHGIDVILVARDMGRLKALASDLKACYGVDARCISADLSKESERVYRETKRLGLKVEMLINNAGISDRGPFKDMDGQVEERIIDLNVNAATTMSRLYGRDMAERKRGRIVFLSSIMGAVPGGPHGAVYAATKAYEKSLSTSLAREMERVGVGVTCVLPGAVKTDFKEGMSDALCWKMPFYPRSSSFVASVAVRAMLKGDSQVTPGWQNRFFLKVMQPMLPQRITTMMVEAQWNPMRLPVWMGGAGEEGAKAGMEGYRERTVFGAGVVRKLGEIEETAEEGGVEKVEEQGGAGREGEGGGEGEGEGEREGGGEGGDREVGGEEEEYPPRKEEEKEKDGKPAVEDVRAEFADFDPFKDFDDEW
ncbi:hypothetical protein TrRE_jg6480 [Triparma retinervis]|uniref:Ketoreductase domain-containing protein n=1 Tax=Triparma retinervis TaxID=2557542 RepID=A0A9W7CEG6_9STRA|nr:hypothetical protein TrRE_jg6480 [Triparma retinervis]